jgi:MFS family permease
MAGNLVSSGLMLAFAGVTWMRTLLFVALTAVAIFGCAAFTILPSLPVDSQESSEETPSPMAALRSTVDVKYALLLPWIIANGMTFGFINADFNSDTTSPLLGSSYVGIIMCVFFATDAVMTIVWGKLISSQALNRRIVFALSTAFWVAFIVLKMNWTRAPNFEMVKGEWTKIEGQEIEAQDVALPVVLAVIAACGDGFWMPGPPQILQSFFARSSLLSSMAAYKALQSLGFAIQFVLGAILHDQVGVRDGILLCVLVIAFISVAGLDLFKQRLDVQNQAPLVAPLQEHA